MTDSQRLALVYTLDPQVVVSKVPPEVTEYDIVHSYRTGHWDLYRAFPLTALPTNRLLPLLNRATWVVWPGDADDRSTETWVLVKRVLVLVIREIPAVSANHGSVEDWVIAWWYLHALPGCWWIEWANEAEVVMTVFPDLVGAVMEAGRKPPAAPTVGGEIYSG